ncbi:glycosyl hydrolase [Planococcus sp. APC 4015]|nr:glycosyl hydrolase [Planococcus sp. APC 4015]
MTTSDDETSRAREDALWELFVDPPDTARPRVWWHWMDGNIDPIGITRDLTWLHDVGVRGVQLFDGGMGVPLVVPRAVRPGSVEWTEAVDTAVRVCGELGLELAVATSSGWSATGGPWVEPQDAMKKVVWSHTTVRGGDHVEVVLPPLPTTTGLYQDAPRWGAAAAPEHSVEWLTLAVPDSPANDPLAPDSVTASSPLENAECLADGSFSDAVLLPRDPDAWSTAWITQSFDAPVTVRSVVVGLPGPRGFGAAPPPDAVLQVSDDDVAYRDVVRLEATSAPARTAGFPPVDGRHFRLALSAGSAADALPPVADGVRVPPVLRRADAFVVSEFALRAGTRVDRAEVKAGFGMASDYFEIDSEPVDGVGVVDPGSVVDLRDFVTDGILRWDAPPGCWRILRLGASLTGQTNGPAPADSTGLEVDKLDGTRIAAYLQTHLARFGDTAAASRFAALLSDSIEAGPQNWTERIVEHFTERRGYDPLPWVAALAGYVIGSASETDRFLFDYRRTLAEVFAAEYYGTLAAEAHRRGMVYYSEALEDGRPQIGDDLAMRSHADVPMGAMWTFDPSTGPRPTYVADLKGASSVAHVHGKKWTGSEAFTSFDRPWSWTPKTLKHIADIQLTLGVTRFCIHTSPHQPIAAPPPGVALAPFLGQAFTVNETWSAMARPWIDYLARCSAILNAGRPAVDVAVFVGEEAPVTALFADAPDDSVPPEFDFDYVGPDALADVLHVEDGRLVSRGASYRMLYLGGSSHRMTLATLAQIERLVDAGATVVGARPKSSPSLVDDEAEFSAVSDRLWQSGRVVDTDVRGALELLGVRPALIVEGGPVRRIARIVDGRLLTFLSNPSELEVRLHLTPADGAQLSGWDPVGVRRTRLARRSDASGGDAFVATLAPFGSVFVLEDHDAEQESPTLRIPLDGTWRLDVPGDHPHSSSPHPVRWTDAGAAGRGFSGTAIYRHEFVLDDAAANSRSVLLAADDVGDIARVVLNGHDCGVVWTAPFHIDVTSAVRPGANSLAIHVATPWRNRLIAETADPSGDVFDPMVGVFEPTASPLPAGLHGQVSLLLGCEAAETGPEQNHSLNRRT